MPTPFQTPPFRALWFARALSALGDGLTLVALMTFVVEKNAGSVALGWILLAQMLPSLLSPWIGALADRTDRRLLLVAGELGQAAVMLLLALAEVSFPVLLVAVFVRSVLSTALKPALSSAIPALVEESQRGQANALLRTAEEGAGVLGPLLAALLVVGIGARGLFLVDSVTFVLAALLLLRLPKLATAQLSVAREPLFASAGAGLRILRSHPVAGSLALGLFFFVLFGAMANLARPLLATASLHAGSQSIGLLFAAPQVGILLGLFLIARLGLGGRTLPAVVGGMLVCALGSLLTAPSPVLWVALAAQLIAGIGHGLTLAAIDTAVQSAVPREVLGRVFANVYGAAYVAAGLAYLLGGPLLAVVTPREMFVIVGLGGLGAALLTGLLLASSRRVGVVPAG